MNKYFAAVSIVAIAATNAHAQNLTGAARNASMPVASTNTRIKAVFGATSSFRINKPIDLYKIRYKSTNERGGAVILSGLLALPRGGAPKGLVVFNHGTIVSRDGSPSRYSGRANGSEAELATLAYGSGGYAVAIPDYLGLGDHTGPHPYPLGVTNSMAGIDMILPARSAANRVGVKVGTPLFITGYSEGGAVAMAATRALESKALANPLYRVTAASPLSGPYDLSGATRQALLSPAANRNELVVRLYLMGYMAYYFHKSEGAKLTNYFKPTLAATVARDFGGTVSDENIIKRLAITATLMGANTSIDRVLTPRFIKAMQTLDTSDPVIRELLKNDCYNWTPRTKMLLVALQNDSVVTYKNTLNMMQAMRARGVKPETVRKYVIKDSKLNHITAVTPALTLSRRFFDGGFAAVKGSE